MTGEHSFTLTPAEGGTRLVQTEIYTGLLARFSAKTTSSFQASFQALNDAIKHRGRERYYLTRINHLGRVKDQLKPIRQASSEARHRQARH